MVEYFMCVWLGGCVRARMVKNVAAINYTKCIMHHAQPRLSQDAAQCDS